MENPESPGTRAARIRRRGLAPLLVLLAAAGFWVVRDPREPRRPAEARTRVVPITSPYKNAAPGVAYIGDAACTAAMRRSPRRSAITRWAAR